MAPAPSSPHERGRPDPTIVALTVVAVVVTIVVGVLSFQASGGIGRDPAVEDLPSPTAQPVDPAPQPGDAEPRQQTVPEESLPRGLAP